jgi:hypothetical protein
MGRENAKSEQQNHKHHTPKDWNSQGSKVKNINDHFTQRKGSAWVAQMQKEFGKTSNMATTMQQTNNEDEGIYTAYINGREVYYCKVLSGEGPLAIIDRVNKTKFAREKGINLHLWSLHILNTPENRRVEGFSQQFYIHDNRKKAKYSQYCEDEHGYVWTISPGNIVLIGGSSEPEIPMYLRKTSTPANNQALFMPYHNSGQEQQKKEPQVPAYLQKRVPPANHQALFNPHHDFGQEAEQPAMLQDWMMSYIWPDKVSPFSGQAITGGQSSLMRLYYAYNIGKNKHLYSPYLKEHFKSSYSPEQLIALENHKYAASYRTSMLKNTRANLLAGEEAFNRAKPAIYNPFGKGESETNPNIRNPRSYMDNKWITRLAKVGGALSLLSLANTAHNIYNSENPSKETSKFGAAVRGSVAGGRAASTLYSKIGPKNPFLAGGTVLAGGLVGSYLGSEFFDEINANMDISWEDMLIWDGIKRAINPIIPDTESQFNFLLWMFGSKERVDSMKMIGLKSDQKAK